MSTGVHLSDHSPQKAFYIRLSTMPSGTHRRTKEKATRRKERKTWPTNEDAKVLLKLFAGSGSVYCDVSRGAVVFNEV